jgi:hypothetical protein
MKYFNIAALISVLGTFSTSVSAQLYEYPRNRVVFEDQSGLSTIGFYIGVREDELLDGYFYTVAAELYSTGADGRFLQREPSSIPFQAGDVVGPHSPFYANPFNGRSGAVALGDYSWRVRYPGNVIFFTSGREYFLNQTEILLGFSRGHPGPIQYGWIRMQRDVTRAQDIIAPNGQERFYVFQPVDYAIHPIAEQPIRAGFAPELPSLSSAVETGEDGSTVIRISWPAGLQGMRLETTYALESPTLWTPVLDVTGNEAVFALPEDGELFFRLNYVP